METCIPRKIAVDSGLSSTSKLAAVFGALSEPARLRIVQILANYGETCTCEIASALKLTQPTVTHHLKILEKASIIYRRPKGKWTYFGLTGDRVSDVLLLADSISKNSIQLGKRIENRLPVSVASTASAAVD